MRISCIISNFNGSKYLPRLLDSIKNQKNVETEIIVVERDSKDNSLEILKSYPEVKIINEPPLSGLVSGYHRGTEIATGDLYFFSNEDMYFDKHCLENLVKFIDLDNRIFAADPWQWTYDQQHWVHGGVAFEKTNLDLNNFHPFYKVNPTVDMESGTKIPFGCAGAILMDAKVYHELGGWDTSFFLDAEDLDFFMRGWQRDWHCVTVKEAKVYHDVSASNEQETETEGRLPGPRRYKACRRNLTLVGMKHFSLNSMHLPAILWTAWISNNILKRRWNMVKWDLEVLKNLIHDVSSTKEYRKQNNSLIEERPAEEFLTFYQ